MSEHEVILYEQTTGRTLLTLNQISDSVGLHPDMGTKILCAWV